MSMPPLARTRPSSPKDNTSRPAPSRTGRRRVQAWSTLPNSPMVNSAGSVPRPKASMTAAPPLAEPLSIADISML